MKNFQSDNASCYHRCPNYLMSGRGQLKISSFRFFTSIFSGDKLYKLLLWDISYFWRQIFPRDTLLTPQLDINAYITLKGKYQKRENILQIWSVKNSWMTHKGSRDRPDSWSSMLEVHENQSVSKNKFFLL